MYALVSYLKHRPKAESTKYILEKYPRFEVFKSIEEGLIDGK